MADSDGYITVGQYGTDEFVEKKSRFIGYAMPVKTADEALEFVKTIKKKHNDARHNCYAYYLKDGSMRYSDDGEPQGTAGQPILEVMTKSGVTDCVIVVTRYFGGVLLGTGGLTRAYTNGAKIAMNAACPIKMMRCIRILVDCDYSLYGSLQQIIAKYEAVTENSDFSDKVSVELLINPEKLEKFSEEVTEISAAKAIICEKGESFLKKSLKD